MNVPRSAGTQRGSFTPSQASDTPPRTREALCSASQGRVHRVGDRRQRRQETEETGDTEEDTGDRRHRLLSSFLPSVSFRSQFFLT
ncbi:hypothetical protein EYF80_062205 [Liparis tanakae]|uniref:Uncharacterized protein n=1 Tax=Liparis tanakae TaxID=230148 RepID=A0A4Z2EFH6_9TELE|nr:hypothetical protein EYF80_062205 [Liparis tanakae]